MSIPTPPDRGFDVNEDAANWITQAETHLQRKQPAEASAAATIALARIGQALIDEIRILRGLLTAPPVLVRNPYTQDLDPMVDLAARLAGTELNVEDLLVEHYRVPHDPPYAGPSGVRITHMPTLKAAEVAMPAASVLANTEAALRELRRLVRWHPQTPPADGDPDA